MDAFSVQTQTAVGQGANLEYEELEKNLVDLNNEKDIPKAVLDKFWEIKEEKGSLPMGISFFNNKDWYIISPREGILWKTP